MVRFGIPSEENWKVVKEVQKGWSKDQKYYIEDEKGQKLLLRIADAERYSLKKAEYDMVRIFNRLDFQMSRALDFGLCNNGENTYMLMSWVDGIPLEGCIQKFSDQKQYELGVEAGQYLKRMNDISLAHEISGWEDKMKAKISRRIEEFRGCGIQVENHDIPIRFVKDHLNLLDHVKLVYQHGDYHIGNLIYTTGEKIGVIDFNRFDIGDYVEEFLKVQAFDREHSIPFAKGKIDGYFDGGPPEEFWLRQALYVAYSCLFGIVWSIPFGKKSVEDIIERYNVTMKDYDNFNRIIPLWYSDK